MTELEKKAEAYVSEKADKGNFDVEKFGKAYFSESSMKQALVKFAEPKEKRIAELESNFRICEKNADTYYDKLTKAKEIIKDLMSFSVQLCDCRHTVDFEKTREQAEQFLKEIEKWTTQKENR